MYKVKGLTDSAKQKLILTVGENETCEFYLYYYPRQYSWYFDWTYNNITSKGNKVVLTPNALRQFKTRIPFGIAFHSVDLIPPISVDDFVSRVSIYTLDSDEVQMAEEEFFVLNGN